MTTIENHDEGHGESGVRPGPGGGEFVISVNAVEAKFADPVPNGGQILGETGFLPAADHVLIQLLRHCTRSVGLDESVDLRQKGSGAFRAFMSDRVFRFTIDGRGYEWGTAKITESDLRIVSGIADDEVFVLRRDHKDVPLATGDVVDLGDSGTEHLCTSKRLVRVCLDGDAEKRIPSGSYTTEQLIGVLGVEAGYLLNVKNAEGELVPLSPGQEISIGDGMMFFSQVPCGGSS